MNKRPTEVLFVRHPTSLSNFHQNLPEDINSVLIVASKSLYVPPFLLSILLFLNTPPGMESRCGTGRRRDRLLDYKDRGSLWGAWRENVGTTLKFVWMPLSTIWCNVQFGMWHFKWKLCFPDESDLGRVELEGVLYFEPYLTAWINNPLFRCWAGARPLLMLSLIIMLAFWARYGVQYRIQK